MLFRSPVGARTAVPTLAQVLTSGNDGGGLDVTNFRYIQANYELQVGNNTEPTSLLNLVNTSTNSYQLVSANNQLVVQQFNPNLAGTLFTLNSNGSVVLCDAGQVAPKVYLNGTQGLSRVYDTLYNIPPSVSIVQSQYYNQQYLISSQINLVPFVSTALTNTYYRMYSIPIVNFPNCCHYYCDVTEIIFFFRNTVTTSTASMTIYLLDKTDLTSITAVDLEKSVQSYAVAPFTYTASQNYNMTTPFTLEYQSQTPPVALSIVMTSNSDFSSVNRYGLYFNVRADTIPYTTLLAVAG